MVLHVLDGEGRVTQINAMPDTGSTHNILEREVLERLGILGTTCKYTVTGHGGHTTTHQAVCATVTVCSPGGKELFQIKFFAYHNPCGGMMPEDWSRIKKGWTHLKRLDIPPPVQGRAVEAILGCVNLSLFEAIRPPASKGPGDLVAWLTPLGLMIGGRTRPEVEPIDKGQSHAHAGTILMAGGEEEKQHEVSQRTKVPDEKKVTNARCFVAGDLNLHHDCGEKCRRDYTELRENMSRIWDLETEAETNNLANSYFPSVRSQKQIQAEAQLLRQLVQLPNGQYQTGLMWSSGQHPHTNWEEARTAFLSWEK